MRRSLLALLVVLQLADLIQMLFFLSDPVHFCERNTLLISLWQYQGVWAVISYKIVAIAVLIGILWKYPSKLVYWFIFTVSAFVVVSNFVAIGMWMAAA